MLAPYPARTTVFSFEPPRDAGARREVLEVLLHVQRRCRCRRSPRRGCVLVERVVVGEAACPFETLERRCSTPSAARGRRSRSTAPATCRARRGTSPSAWCPGSSMTLRSRCTRARPVEQERRHRVGHAAERGGLGRQRRCRGVKLNRPRGPPASCVCSSMSRLCRHSPPNFTRVRAHQLGQRRRDVPRLLGAIPRLAGREPEQRVAE